MFYTTRFGKRSFDAENNLDDSTEKKFGESFDMRTEFNQNDEEQVLARIQNFLEGKLLVKLMAYFEK